VQKTYIVSLQVPVTYDPDDHEYDADGVQLEGDLAKAIWETVAGAKLSEIETWVAGTKESKPE
jgi:adenosylcobinamide amidohydrolase